MNPNYVSDFHPDFGFFFFLKNFEKSKFQNKNILNGRKALNFNSKNPPSTLLGAYCQKSSRVSYCGKYRAWEYVENCSHGVDSLIQINKKVRSLNFEETNDLFVTVNGKYKALPIHPTLKTLSSKDTRVICNKTTH